MTPVTLRHAVLTAATIVLLAPRAQPEGAQDAAAGPGTIVSMAWLAAHLDDPRVAVIATGGDEEAFDRAHVPGARFVPHTDTLGRDHGQSSSDAFATVMARAGATDDTQIVLYGDDPMLVGWLFMNLAATGHASHTSLLDGNLGAWREAGHVVASGAPAAADAGIRFTPLLDPGVVVDAIWVRAHLDDASVRLLDVRSEREWAEGTIPAAVPVLWQDLYADLGAGRFKDQKDLWRVLARAGVGEGQTVVTYCAVGMRASLMYFAARALGLPARVYVGSWTDWRSRPGFPIARK